MSVIWLGPSSPGILEISLQFGQILKKKGLGAMCFSMHFVVTFRKLL